MGRSAKIVERRALKGANLIERDTILVTLGDLEPYFSLPIMWFVDKFRVADKD